MPVRLQRLRDLRRGATVLLLVGVRDVCASSFRSGGRAEVPEEWARQGAARSAAGALSRASGRCRDASAGEQPGPFRDASAGEQPGRPSLGTSGPWRDASAGERPGRPSLGTSGPWRDASAESDPGVAHQRGHQTREPAPCAFRPAAVAGGRAHEPRLECADLGTQPIHRAFSRSRQFCGRPATWFCLDMRPRSLRRHASDRAHRSRARPSA